MITNVNLKLTEIADLKCPKIWEIEGEEYVCTEITHNGGNAEFEITTDEIGNIQWRPVSLFLNIVVAPKGWFSTVQFTNHTFAKVNWVFLGRESHVSQSGCFIEVTTIEGALTQKGGEITAYWSIKAF